MYTNLNWQSVSKAIRICPIILRVVSSNHASQLTKGHPMSSMIIASYFNVFQEMNSDVVQNPTLTTRAFPNLLYFFADFEKLKNDLKSL